MNWPEIVLNYATMKKISYYFKRAPDSEPTEKIEPTEEIELEEGYLEHEKIKLESMAMLMLTLPASP